MARTLQPERVRASHVKLLTLFIMALCLIFAREARAQESEGLPVEKTARAKNKEASAPPAHTLHEDAPSIEDLHEATLLFQGLSPGPQDAHFDALRKRARRANALPELNLKSSWRLQQDEEDDYREDLTIDPLGLVSSDGARRDLKSGEARQDTYSVELRFDLPGLVFDRQEIDLERLRQLREGQRIKLLSQINELYFRRERLLSRLRSLDLDPEEQLEHHVTILHCDAELDALSGGWFSKNLRKTNEKP